MYPSCSTSRLTPHCPPRCQAGDAGADGDGLMAAFAKAAEAVAARRAEEALPLEDRIAAALHRWCDEWGADLEARPQVLKDSGPGHQATLVYRQSMAYMDPLYDRLKRRMLEEELVVSGAACGRAGSLCWPGGGAVLAVPGDRSDCHWLPSSPPPHQALPPAPLTPLPAAARWACG